MSTVRTSVEVDVPVTRAYNQWTQFESFPEFMDGVESVTQIDETLIQWKVKVGGIARQYDTTITEQAPDSVIAWQSIGGDLGEHRGRVVFEPLTATSTRIDIELGWEPAGLVEKVGAAFHVDQRQVDHAAEEFKRFIENRGAETGAWRGAV